MEAGGRICSTNKQTHECVGRKERTVGLPVLGVVAGFLWGKWAGQSGHLDPHGVVQILLTGVDSAGDDERHAEQTGPVLLR